MNEIIDTIGMSAFLEQLAEECSELSQASLKFARKLRGENPTPKDGNEIYADLLEECADVELCISILGQLDKEFRIGTYVIEFNKLERWKERLKTEMN